MNTRRKLTGVVVKNKMDKTVVVEITRHFRHPLYRKVVTNLNRVKAHDELSCSIGDKVTIIETKPISKTKRWAVIEILKREERLEDIPEA
ncbi:MAG: 30S ribosomal protein S17 [Anaerolineales bacterium]|jgi:small subunit ribosomal protein S17